MQAARHGHSMEEEIRIILRSALNQPQAKGLGTRIRERFADAGGIELEVPPGSEPRDPGFSA
ncbi:FitA-like ribbon-helix-helix domain-containing protein [Halomonas sp. DP8Y7-1]|uniref:FitA-like ribbon-helix-helix domain-containing protein n=1 Tax=Halomonas sp. DP8Y7-1 TaxID=2859078 RepID=UPI00396583B0